MKRPINILALELSHDLPLDLHPFLTHAAAPIGSFRKHPAVRKMKHREKHKAHRLEVVQGAWLVAASGVPWRDSVLHREDCNEEKGIFRIGLASQRAQGQGDPMGNEPNNLLFNLRDCGRVIAIPKVGERVYELGGRQYRCFLVPEKDRDPGEGPWRAEEMEAFRAELRSDEPRLD